MFKPDPVEQELRDAILACRPGASISVVGGKHNLVLTVVVQRPSPHLEEDGFVRDVVKDVSADANGWVPKPEPEATSVFFDVWYALTQIYEEASSWMRERGVTDDTTLGFIFDRAKMARELVDRPDVRSLLDQIPSVPTPRAVNILGGISYAERRALEDSPPGEDD